MTDIWANSVEKILSTFAHIVSQKHNMPEVEDGPGDHLVQFHCQSSYLWWPQYEAEQDCAQLAMESDQGQSS